VTPAHSAILRPSSADSSTEPAPEEEVHQVGDQVEAGETIPAHAHHPAPREPGAPAERQDPGGDQPEQRARRAFEGDRHVPEARPDSWPSIEPGPEPAAGEVGRLIDHEVARGHGHQERRRVAAGGRPRGERADHHHEHLFRNEVADQPDQGRQGDGEEERVGLDPGQRVGNRVLHLREYSGSSASGQTVGR